MKKYFVLLLSLVLILIQVTGTYAKIGDIITYTKHTDICAYVNNYIIPSYNIEGYTGIVAEDLRNYGFNVIWNEHERTLSISRNCDVTTITEYLTPTETEPSKLGKNADAVLETDIKAYVNGAEVKSYNIGGQTIIIFDVLSAFGGVEWNEYSRKIKLWINDGLNKSNYETQPLPFFETTLHNDVYRTPYGKRYHFDPDCGGKNSYKITLKKALSAGLTACKKCAY